MMNKSTVDPNGNYADYLAGTVESNKASFTEAELKTLTEDIDAIRKIEEQIAEIENKTTSDSSKKNNTETFNGNKTAKHTQHCLSVSCKKKGLKSLLLYIHISVSYFLTPAHTDIIHQPCKCNTIFRCINSTGTIS